MPGGITELLEREAELQVLRAQLAGASSGEGAVTVIEAPAGVGKSRLLRTLRRLAAAEGFAVYAAAASELEAEHPYGVVRQLFGGGSAPTGRKAHREHPRRRVEGVLQAARLAGPRFGGPEVLHGLYWLVADATERAPLLIVLDDVHWADPESLQAIEFLARRAADLPLFIAVALRSDLAGNSRLIEALLARPEVTVLRPKSLTPAACEALVRQLLPDAPQPLCSACAKATAGNPFLLRELALQLSAEGATAAMPAEEILAMTPPRVARSVALRLALLAPAARALAAALSVLERADDIGPAAQLARLDLPEAADAVSSLRAADIVDDGLPLRFAHPIVQTAVYGTLSEQERSDAHERVAWILIDRGDPAGAVAPHLLRAPPAGEPAVVEILEEAAASAPASAVPLLRRALAEPPSDAQRPSVLAALGAAELKAGQPEGTARLIAAVKRMGEPRDRAHALRELGQALVLHGRFVESLSTFERGAAELEPEAGRDREAAALRVILHAEAAATAQIDVLPADEVRQKLRRLDGPVPDDPAAAAATLAVAAFQGVRELEPVEQVAQTAERAVAGDIFHRDGFLLSPITAVAYQALAAAGRFDQVEAHLAAGNARSRANEHLLSTASRCALFSVFLLAAGRIDAAEAEVWTALGIDSSLAAAAVLAGAAGFFVMLERGDPAEALRLAETSGVMRLEADELPWVSVLIVRGIAKALQGDLAAAVAEISGAGDRLAVLGNLNPAAVSWRQPAVAIHAALGQHEEALMLAEEEVRAARRFGADWSLSAALRLQAGVAPPGDRRALLEEAIEHAERADHPLERARALRELGAVNLAEARLEAAREQSRLALDLAEQTGSELVAAAAAEQLLAAGGRARRRRVTGPSALTESERRIAELAAAGQTNREIAEASFVTIKTVETHLGAVYRKLGIASRKQISGALGGAARMER